MQAGQKWSVTQKEKVNNTCVSFFILIINWQINMRDSKLKARKERQIRKKVIHTCISMHVGVPVENQDSDEYITEDLKRKKQKTECSIINMIE